MVQSIPQINQYKSYLHIHIDVQCTTVGLAFCYSSYPRNKGWILFFIHVHVGWEQIYIVTHNKVVMNPLSLKPFKWNPSKYKQCKNPDYLIFSGMLAFNSLSQRILMLQWFCYPCVPLTQKFSKMQKNWRLASFGMRRSSLDVKNVF